MADLKLTLHRQESPMGECIIASDGAKLYALDMHGDEIELRKILAKHYPGCQVDASTHPHPWVNEFNAYFDGRIDALDALPVAEPGTEFQRKVWKELRKIPAGATKSYGELAKAIGQPTASRAVGLANGANPIGIVVPCHRVIGADGSLTGYGGGLDRKKWLLRHEGVEVA